jgi:hypothetical protein
VASKALPDQQKAIVILACCFASVLPDVAKYPYFIFKGARRGVLKKWVECERKFQVDTDFAPGMLTQLMVIVTSLLSLRSFLF